MLSSLRPLFLLFIGTCAFHLRSNLQVRPRSLDLTAAKEGDSFLDAEWFSTSLNLVEQSRKVVPVDGVQEMKAMLMTDISRADNFFEGTLPNIQRLRREAMKEKDLDKMKEIDENFYALMDIGFDKRYSSSLTSRTRSSFPSLKKNAKRTALLMELGKSKIDQLAEMKRERLERRSKFVRMFPEKLHVYFDYLNSLYVKPAKSDLNRNLSLGAFFSSIVLANRALRSAFMFSNVANLILISTMLTRNIPEAPVQPGMGRRRVATWSGSAFRTAVGITLYYFLGSAALMASLLAVFPLPLAAKFKAALVTGVMSTSYFSTFYEVYEEKGKGGWRWQKALGGTSIEDVNALIEQNARSKRKVDIYDFAYDPMVEEFPPQQIYIDEVPGEQPQFSNASGDMDEGEWKDHYDNWRVARKDSRRAPIEDAPPETEWVGGKVGMYVSKVPTWIGSAYKKGVTNMNKWRGKKPIHKKDTSEFEPVEGPLGFRDKRPDWLDMFGSGVWEEKGTASKKAARDYGTYRKTMWKKDNKVVLQKCDE